MITIRYSTYNPGSISFNTGFTHLEEAFHLGINGQPNTLIAVRRLRNGKWSKWKDPKTKRVVADPFEKPMYESVKIDSLFKVPGVLGGFGGVNLYKKNTPTTDALSEFKSMCAKKSKRQSKYYPDVKKALKPLLDLALKNKSKCKK